jgi:hypothetical protein
MLLADVDGSFENGARLFSATVAHDIPRIDSLMGQYGQTARLTGGALIIAQRTAPLNAELRDPETFAAPYRPDRQSRRWCEFIELTTSAGLTDGAPAFGVSACICC